MSRVVFDTPAVAPQINTLRADVACFVGLARVLAGASVPPAVSGWLTTLGFPAASVGSLTNVPLPFESVAAFTTLFDDGAAGTGSGTDYLAAAVRSFFAQGGKKCYVVRVADPVNPQTTAGNADVLTAVWSGVAALGVLEEVSLLVVPDLPALCATAPVGAAGQVPVVPLGPQQFALCATGPVVPTLQRTFQAAAPRLTASDYDRWADNVAQILNYLAGGALRHQPHLREIQFVVALPLPQSAPGGVSAGTASQDIVLDIRTVLARKFPETRPPPDAVMSSNLSSAFLQLGYPWLKTSGSATLLEQLEPPDGALAGLIACNALTRGAFTSATKIVPAEIYDVSPALPAVETRSGVPPLTWSMAPGSPPKPLIERISLFGLTPAGMRLLSDVTAYPGASCRSAAVNRLVSVICRAARTMGESALFQTNGPALWGRVQRYLQNLLTRLWTLNALAGASAAEAFSVRCDAGMMTQNDLDNARLLAEVTFTAAATLETLQVQLAVEAGGTSTQEVAADWTAGAASLGNVSASSLAGAA